MWLDGSTLVNSFVDQKGDAWEFSCGLFLVISRTESLGNNLPAKSKLHPELRDSYHLSARQG